MIADLNLYRIFHAVASYQNVSHAARSLYISQPAVSKSIQTLENALNIKLFTRTSKGVLLTPEGEIFYEHIKKAFTNLEEGEKLLSKLTTTQLGALHLGVSSTLGTSFLLPLLSDFTMHHPSIQLHISNDTTKHILSMLSKGLLDLAIVSTPMNTEGLFFTPLFSIHDILVCSPTYYELIKDFSFEKLCSRAIFMMLSSPSITREHLQNHFSNLGTALIPQIESSDMDFLIASCKAGLGITSVIKEFAGPLLEKNTLIEVPLHLPIAPRVVGTCYSLTKQPSTATDTFISFIKSNHPLKNNYVRSTC